MQREEVRVTQVREELSMARGAIGEKEQLIARLRVELHDSNERSARAAAEVRELRDLSLVLRALWLPVASASTSEFMCARLGATGSDSAANTSRK